MRVIPLVLLLLATANAADQRDAAAPTPGATIRGRVADADGRPVVRATVSVWPIRVDRPMRAVRSRSDLNGAFELRHLPAGTFRIEVAIGRTPGGTRPAIVYYPGVTTREQALLVELTEGATVDNLTIVVPRILESSLTVRVPRPDARVTNLAVSILRASPLAVRPLELNADGVATVTGMAPGRYFVAAKAGSGQRLWAGFSVVDFDEVSQEVALRLQRTGTIEGRIVGNTRERPPLDDVRIGAVWIHDGTEVSPLVPDQAAVATNGAFRIDGVFGTRRLQLVGLDWRWEIRSVRQGRTDVQARGIGIRPAATVKVTIVVGRRITEPLSLLQ